MTTVTTPTTSPAPVRTGKPTGWIAATILAAVLALVGMLAAVFMAYAGPAVSHDSSSSSAAVVTHHKHADVTPAHQVTPVTPAHPVTPKVTPSDSIKLEQQELGRLNYYEGPINGYYTQATINAVKYLQRDAGLPQTGQMNTATQSALATMLATGNNHMAG